MNRNAVHRPSHICEMCIRDRYWYVEAKKVGIDFSVNLNIPMEMPFRGADICLILGNLLENAVEAARCV